MIESETLKNLSLEAVVEHIQAVRMNLGAYNDGPNIAHPIDIEQARVHAAEAERRAGALYQELAVLFPRVPVPAVAQ